MSVTAEPVTIEASLYLEKEMARCDCRPFAGGTAAVFSTRSTAKPGPNEDASALISYGNGSGVLIVSDGAGGARLGGEAARLTVRSLATALRRGASAGVPLRSAVLDGIEQANVAVAGLAAGAAATVSVVQIENGAVRPVHAGDSVILVTGQRGRVKHQNISHGPVGYAVEAGLLDETEALHHEERHLVSNVVGSLEMRIEIGPSVPLASYDTVVLASDGLSDNLYLEEIVERVRKGKLAAVADGLAAACLERMASPVEGEPSKPDDLTFILYRRKRG